MKLLKLITALSLSSAMLAGCGGSSSSSNTPGTNPGTNPGTDPGTNPGGGQPTPQEQVVKGFVFDPAVEQAVVKLCKIADLNDCQVQTTVTNAMGAYQIKVPGDIDLAQYIVVSRGGIDTGTGESLGQLKFYAPASLKDGESIMVTPVTSMVALKMKKKGITRQAAVAEVASELDVSADNVKKKTDVNANMARKGMILTLVGLQKDTGLDDLTVSGGNMDALIDGAVDDADDKAAMKAVNANMKKKGSASEAVKSLVVYNTIVHSELFDSQDLTDANVKANLDKVSDKVQAALTAAGVQKPNKGQVIYLLNQMGALDVTAADLVVADITIPEGVDLASMKVDVFKNHTVPMSAAFGTEDLEKAKRDYYFTSTASHFAKAEQMMRGVTDVETLDTSYFYLSKGYIRNGSAQIALNMSSRKLFIPKNEGEILLEVAEYFIDENKEADKAEAALDKSFVAYKAYITSKGASSISNSDILSLSRISVGLNKLGKTAKGQAVITYMDSLVAEFGDFSNPYTAFMAGLDKAAQAYIEKGETDIARTNIEKMYDISKITPPNFKSKYPTKSSKWYYLSRVMYMRRAAETYYWDLATPADKAKANQIIDEMKALRADDGIADNPGTKGTAYKTDLHMANYIVPILLDQGITQADFETFVAGLERSSYVAKSWAKFAVTLAKTDVNAAIQLVEDKVTSADFGSDYYRDVFEAFTYYGVSPDQPNLGMKLIDDGELAKAKTVTDRAKVILDEAVKADIESSDKNRTTYYVQRGYNRLGYMYHKMNEKTLSEDAFAMAKAISTNTATGDFAGANITDTERQVYAMSYITREYFKLGEKDKAVALSTTTRQMALALTDIEDKIDRLGTLASVTHEWDGGLPEADLALNEAYTIVTGSSPIDDGSAQEDLEARAKELHGSKNKAFYFSGGLIDDFLEVDNYDKSAEAINALLGYTAQIAAASNKANAYIGAAHGWALHGNVEKAIEVADMTETKPDRLNAIKYAARGFYSHDMFDKCSVATVDSDRDGKPDFYDFDATAEEIAKCGLTLDNDSDNDGVMDWADLTPFHADAS